MFPSNFSEVWGCETFENAPNDRLARTNKAVFQILAGQHECFHSGNFTPTDLGNKSVIFQHL